VDELVAILRKEPQKLLIRMGIWFAVVSVPMVFGPVWLTFGNAGGLPVPFRFLLFVGFLVAYSMLFPKLVANPRLQNALCYCAVKLKDKRMLGPLVARVNALTGKRREAVLALARRVYQPDVNADDVEAALLEGIKTLAPEDYVDISGSERTALRMHLRSNNVSLVLILIQLLKTAGGSGDLSLLHTLAKGGLSGRASAEVREAASACVEVVESRLRDNLSSESLLRASQPSTQEDHLLRPASDSNNVEVDNLLRASQQQPNLAAVTHPKQYSDSGAEEENEEVTVHVGQ